MFCPRCGKELKNNQRFCINCGYDLSEELSEVKNNQDDFYKKKSYYKQPKEKKGVDVNNIRFDIITGFLFKVFLTVVVIGAVVVGLRVMGNYLPTDTLGNDRAKYETYMQDPSAIPELTQPETLSDLISNLKDVQNFLVLYLKYSDDSAEDKSKVFDNYRKQLLKIETFSNDNLIKEDIKNSLPQTKKDFNKCAKYYNKLLAPVGLKIVSDTAYARYHLEEDYRFTYKKFGAYVDSDMKSYLYLRAKHNSEFLENGGYLSVTPKEMNKRISDYEKFMLHNKDFAQINEVKDYLYYYTFGYIFASDRQEMKAITHKTFKKWDKKFIKQNKSSQLNPIFSKMVTSANGISPNQFDNLYPYEYEKMLNSIRPQSGDLEDIISDIRKSVMKEMSNIGYKYVYSQAEGMWTPFSDSVKISKDSLLLADNGQGGFDVYNNKFKKTNQVLNIDPNTKIMIKRGQLLIYNPQCLQISKIDYTYGSFSTKVISSKEIRQYFPDVLIINVDNIGTSPVQVTKTTEKQSYMLISHAGSNFEGYTLNADAPIEQGELNNIFTINTTNPVNLEWIPTSGDGKQYYIVFVTNMPEQPKTQESKQSPQVQTQAPATTLP